MARRSGKRDAFVHRYPQVLSPLFRLPLRLAPVRRPEPLGDRRLYHPVRRFRLPDVFVRRSSMRIEVAHPSRPMRLAEVHRFAAPRDVMLCARRKERREVLFAHQYAGRGSGRRQRRQPKRRNYWSVISCR